VRTFLDLVRFEHSVFALPFAYIATLSAMNAANSHVHWIQLLLVTIAMVGARTFAMAVNRIVDRHIDARNPRTRGRELVTGAVSLRTAWVGAAVSLAILILAAAGLNVLCLALSPVAALVLAGYPYAKRFTWAPHAVLGLAQTIGPIGAWIAVTGHWSWTGVVLGVAVGFWIGGFDIIYALQDYEVDREIGVKSLPARFGPHAALACSRAAHYLTVLFLLWFGLLANFGWVWTLGVIAAAVALAILFLAAYGLNTLCLALSPIAAIVLAGYPYAKRFTWAPHAVLGLAQTIGPIGAWLAVTAHWSWTAVVLGAAVGFWIGGFDIIYALQDYEIDREIGVKSLPARFGPHAALACSRAAHYVTVLFLLWFGLLAGFGWVWTLGVIVAAFALAYEQRLVKPTDLSNVNKAFFTVNGFVGIGLFLFALVDLAARGLRP
jgi:4-hydroxybenzoate polyprenyltransferase